MNLTHLKTIAIVLILGSVTAAFYWLANDEGERKKLDFLGLVLQINELNARVDAEVFSIHYGVVNDFDRLTSFERQLRDTVAPWKLQIAALDCLEPWQGKAELVRLLDQKQSRVEDFKSMKSVMRNSLASFVRLATSLLNHEESQSVELLKHVADVRWRGLEFALSANTDTEVRFRACLVQLENASQSRTSSYRNKVALLQRHSQVLLSRGMGLEKTIREISDHSSESLLGRQMAAVSLWATQEKLTSNRFRFALFVSTVLLIAYCGVKMAQVQRMMRQLAESNAMLDHRVASRTRELQAKTDEAEQLALVVRYTDNAVIISDDQGRIQWTNEGFTRISGYPLKEVIGLSPGKLLQGPETSQATVRRMRDAIAARKGFDLEIVNYHKNGAPYWLAIEVRPIVDQTGNVVKFIAIQSDITARKNAQAERDALQAEMLAISRQAGMAEVATGVLHNVGNVLNSVNVSANIVVERLKSSRVGTLAKASSVISEQPDLADFFSSDPRGKSFPRLLQELATNLSSERDAQLCELHSLVENIDHIKEIVNMQQAFGKVHGTTELVDMVKLFEEALRIDDAAFARHKVEVVRQFNELPPILTEKHSVMQILLNLIGNAKQSVNEFGGDHKTLTLTLDVGNDDISIQVRDNGVGIQPDNLSKVFTHGFTTKSNGHGFGLHSCALAAQKLGGSLSAHSDGIGRGATFTLRLPTNKESLCKV